MKDIVVPSGCLCINKGSRLNEGRREGECGEKEGEKGKKRSEGEGEEKE